MPLGAWTLWPDSERVSTPFHCFRSMGMRSHACTASTWKWVRLFFLLTPAASAAMSCTAPVSLFTAMQAASTVRLSTAARNFSVERVPSRSGRISTTLNPKSRSARMGRCTLGCSNPDTTILSPQSRRGSAAPHTAMLLLSDPQAVKYTSSLRQFSVLATRARAVSSESWLSTAGSYRLLGLAQRASIA